MASESMDWARVCENLEALRQEVGRLSERVAALERKETNRLPDKDHLGSRPSLPVSASGPSNPAAETVSEELIAEALAPYGDGLVIGTKGGLTRGGPGDWRRDGRPQHLRVACEASLKRLRVDRIEHYQLHSPDPRVPLEDSIGALVDLQRQGKIRHIGVSNVDARELAAAREVATIVSVQNRYNLADRSSEPVLTVCQRDGIAFLPWFPLSAGSDAASASPALAEVAARHSATPAQVAIAWLLARSPVMLPIPGTSSVTHLEENLQAARLRLSAADRAALD